MYDPELHRNHAREFGHDTKIFTLSSLSLVLTAKGLVEEGMNAISRGHEWAQSLGSAHSSAMMMAYELGMWHYRDEPEQVARLADNLIKYSVQNDFPVWLSLSNLLSGWAHGNLELAEQSADAFQAMGTWQFASYWNFPVAQLELSTGQPEKALSRIDRFVNQALSVEELFYLSEHYRLRANCNAILHPENPSLALTDVEQSLAMAQRIGAGLFELRTLLDSIEMPLPEETRPKRIERVRALLSKLHLRTSVKEYRRARALI
jgi:hypothetical protein